MMRFWQFPENLCIRSEAVLEQGLDIWEQRLGIWVRQHEPCNMNPATWVWQHGSGGGHAKAGPA
jgi:hypothetical protein